MTQAAEHTTGASRKIGEIMVTTEYKCQCCSMDIDETEYGDVRDADICGYCFADRVNDIRSRNLEFPAGLNECGINREIALLADMEIRLETAQSQGDARAVEIYERMIRLIEA